MKNKEPLLFKAIVSDNGDLSGLLNVDFKEGMMLKRKGWRTFDEMVRVLEKLNTRYKSLGYSGDFTVRLPLNRSRKNKVQL